ncbi:hypothetical protein GMMP15_110003 [Candidatus Magnetomoraceae bacterium gMMP-15]
MRMTLRKETLKSRKNIWIALRKIKNERYYKYIYISNNYKNIQNLKNFPYKIIHKTSKHHFIVLSDFKNVSC